MELDYTSIFFGIVLWLLPSYCQSSLQTKNISAQYPIMGQLKDLGYGYNSEGRLCKLNNLGEPSDEPFKFNISANHDECQKHYEEVGEAVTFYIYNLLESQEKLNVLPVPIDSTSDTGTFIFGSEGYDKKDTLMILIHGSGVVRAGQWARRLLMNNSLKEGSQIPYIQRAKDKGFGVLVLNTNDNHIDNKPIPKSSDPVAHALYVWKNYVKETEAKSIVIVAHSYGGVVTAALSEEVWEDFETRVKGVAFTDAVHSYPVSEYMQEITTNWVRSLEPLDTPMTQNEGDVRRVSAGSNVHEWTSHAAIDSVFKFLDEKLSTAATSH